MNKNKKEKNKERKIGKSRTQEAREEIKKRRGGRERSIGSLGHEHRSVRFVILNIFPRVESRTVPKKLRLKTANEK